MFPDIVTEKMVYIYQIDTAKRLVNTLKKIHKCDIIIALTHMRITR